MDRKQGRSVPGVKTGMPAVWSYAPGDSRDASVSSNLNVLHEILRTAAAISTAQSFLYSSKKLLGRQSLIGKPGNREESWITGDR